MSSFFRSASEELTSRTSIGVYGGSVAAGIGLAMLHVVNPVAGIFLALTFATGELVGRARKRAEASVGSLADGEGPSRSAARAETKSTHEPSGM